MAEERVRILLVEDESLIAELIVDILTTQGYLVAGPIARIADAMRTVDEEEFDAVVLDVDLAGTSSYPVAAVLASRNVPFVFLTGFGKGGLRAEYAKRPTVAKPFRPKDLLVALSRVLEPQAIE
jgi:DNA-binding response OmpR family regulator